MGNATASTHNQTISHPYRQMCRWPYRNCLLKLSGNGASTIVVGAQHDTQQRSALWSSLFLNRAIKGQSSLYVLVFNFRNMHAMSDWSDLFLACSSRVKIEEPAFYFTITLLLTVTQVELRSEQIPTAMLDSKCLKTLWLEFMISSKNQCVFFRDLSNLSLWIVFDAWLASMNVGSNCPIAWDNHTHVSPWRFYLHWGIEETGSHGIICIVCHRVLRHPSEHGNSSIGKHLLAKAHIAKLNQFTESEIAEWTTSTFDETALAILKTQGSRGITIVSLQRNFILDI